MPNVEIPGKATAAGDRELTLQRRLIAEMRRYAIVATYLYICFGALQLYKAALLHDEGVRYIPLGIAAAKALILAKFLLVGEAAGAGKHLRARTLVHRSVHRVVFLFVVVLLLSALEEAVVGWIHHRTLAETLSEHLAGAVPEMAATSFVVLLILVPLALFNEISEALGEGQLLRLLFDPATGSGGDSSAARAEQPPSERPGDGPSPRS